MLDLDIRPSDATIPRRRYVADGPIDFESWLRLAQDLDTELLRGVITEKMSAQFPHEWIFAWLFKVLGAYVENRQLGIVLGSRTAVKITDIDGRLPDLLFVRVENVAIIQKKAIYGVPDLVIEIVSENDRPSDLIPLEADYRDLGVPEILFIDPRQKRLRYLSRIENAEHAYTEEFLTDGELVFKSIPGFHIEVSWLFEEQKPDGFTVTKQLIEEAEKGNADPS